MRILAVIGALAILVVIVAAIFFFGGFYSVAANEADPGILSWAIGKVRIASIERHANTAPPGNLEDQQMIQAGAKAFSQRGCVNCHGAPGVNWQKFSEGLNPDPPDLKEIAGERAPAQLFWVVKNGIRMTGMPSFGAIGADDKEVWSIVAFVKKLPTVSEADYKAWTAGP